MTRAGWIAAVCLLFAAAPGSAQQAKKPYGTPKALPASKATPAPAPAPRPPPAAPCMTASKRTALLNRREADLDRREQALARQEAQLAKELARREQQRKDLSTKLK